MNDLIQHVHIVFSTSGTGVSPDTLKTFLATAGKLVDPSRVHVISPDAEQLADAGQFNQIKEPLQRGRSAAIAYAGCHLYRLDPTATMVLVPADEVSVDALRNSFQDIVLAADAPGSLVAVHQNAQPTGVYAWSVYSLMETFRNYCPVDFPIINEIVRTWNSPVEAKRDLYAKLESEGHRTAFAGSIDSGLPDTPVDGHDGNRIGLISSER